MTLKRYSAGQTDRHISSRQTSTTGLILPPEQWMMGILAKYLVLGEAFCTIQTLEKVMRKI